MISKHRLAFLRRRQIGLWLALIAFVLLTKADVSASETSNQSGGLQAMPEYLVKSAMLYHFARFTKWPEGTFDDSNSPYKFCVIGQDPFGPDLDALLGETIRDRDIVTMRIRKVQHAKGCHLLFIAASEIENLSNIFEQLADASVLTIGDMDDFTKSGGIIQLKLVEDRVRFEINLEVAKRVGLAFRSELLLLADTVSGEVKRSRFDTLTN